MTREEAVEIRVKHLHGEKVRALDLQLALHVLAKRRDKRFKLPALPRAVREMANATLCFNLGKALK